MLEIINVPSQTLRQTSKPVKKIDQKSLTLIHQMIEVLTTKTDPPGVGLSAIQVGIPLQIFITYLPHDPKTPSDKWDDSNLEIITYINPKITKTARNKTLGGSRNNPMLEGCLSIPHFFGPVSRHQWVEVEYQTINISRTGSSDGGHVVDSSEVKLQTATAKLEDFPARVFQHELDHLNGVLFTDYTLKDSQPIYYEQGKDLVEIENPQDIIGKW